MAIPTALMRGHTHAGEGSLYCQQAFGCPAGMPMRREGTPGSAKAQIRGHRSIAVGTPRGRLTECSEVAAAFEHWGGESRGVINGDLGDLCSSEQCPRLGL